MTRPIFVVSAKEVYEGSEAIERLQATNDSAYETPDGVLQVDDARWQTAQEYERYSWLVHNANLSNDRNDIHAEGFGNYEALPDDLGQVVELGCGAFTNLRIILEGRTASKVYLVDPLAADYQKEHANCAYKDGTLKGHEVTVVAKAIEDWNTRAKFDTVVMVNVIPHCKDALAIFETIRKLLRPGGYLVIGEFPREHPASLHYDAGHPLALKAHVVDAFLTEFEEVYRNGYYFIGQAK